MRTLPAGPSQSNVAFSPDGRWIAAAGGVAGGDIKLWQVESGQELPTLTGHSNWKIIQADLTSYRSPGFDLVYCIGVLHHLRNPKAGLDAVVANVAPGGRFHCWVYAREGNSLVIHLVEPLRRIFCRFPWWFIKYGVATPLAIPFYLYAKLVAIEGARSWARKLPLAAYCRWKTFLTDISVSDTPQGHIISCNRED